MTEDPRDHDEPIEPAAEQPFDVEAEFAKIVDAYGDQPADVTPPPTPESLSDRFQSRGWSDPLNTEASWDDEGHFVPPEPPPLVVPEPIRLAAWGGVFGAPLVMLAMVLFRVSPPEWVTFFLVSGFVSGFVYLVATMKRDDDRWPGDDGAVL